MVLLQISVENSCRIPGRNSCRIPKNNSQKFRKEHSGSKSGKLWVGNTGIDFWRNKKKTLANLKEKKILWKTAKKRWDFGRNPRSDYGTNTMKNLDTIPKEILRKKMFFEGIPNSWESFFCQSSIVSIRISLRISIRIPCWYAEGGICKMIPEGVSK